MHARLQRRTFLPTSRVLCVALFAISFQLSAQPPTPAALQRPGGPNSGPAPAPPPLAGDALQHPGVPTGTLSDRLTLRSQAYDGMVSNYWIYVPAQYDAKTPAAVMVFQDGEGYLNRNGGHPALNALDNLIAAGKIPVMIAIFTNPGDIAASPGTPTYSFVEAYSKKWSRTLKDSMRSTEYDTVSDRYDRFLLNELIPEVAKRYNLRTDAYSRAITGSSSGGICSFNAAWQHPEAFSRVISWIGSFTAIQWKEDPANPDGGQDYPEKILREPHHNIRVWIQDGNNDQENPNYGSWPLANIRMANALKLKGYDFRFTFGKGPHSQAEGAAEFPEELVWLWRGYDPAKTSETFTQDPDEAAKPPFRVAIVNR
jgi:enterochelin esterase-like enzyme